MQEDFNKMVAFAIEQEANAKIFYRNVAARTTQKSIKEKFLKLADEEERHERMLVEILKKRQEELNFKESEDYGVAATVESPTISDEMTLADVFAIAMKNEEKAMLMYQQMAKDAPTPEIKKFFEELAKMMQNNNMLTKEEA